MQRVSSLVAIYSVVHFKAGGSLGKHYKVKMLKPGQTSALLFQSTVEKEYVVH